MASKLLGLYRFQQADKFGEVRAEMVRKLLTSRITVISARKRASLRNENGPVFDGEFDSCGFGGFP